ncbi:MAG: asparagine synthetase B [Bacteroidetes bacterium QH_8_67_23]|nr:MAG: asparagine synthetase B [Bacteroidetes bacterium QH_8_67_23]
MRSLKTLCLLLALLVATAPAAAQDLLVPMGKESQSNHLKAYGAAFAALEKGRQVDWLLNYRGGAFLMPATEAIEKELRVRGVSFEALSSGAASKVVADVENNDENTALVRLETAPKIAVYAPTGARPWDDAVRMALEYANVPYDVVYDEAVLDGKLGKYDWLHLHHEDFTGQFGKFIQYQDAAWYIEQQKKAEKKADQFGFKKVSQLKSAVAEKIKGYVQQGGFLFSMCSGTDTFDIALAARGVDIVPPAYDGDPVDPNALSQLNFERTMAFKDFRPVFNATEYEHSNIDTGPPPSQMRDPSLDYFTLFDFSAKWDPVPTMLTQNHVATVKGFVGQTTYFNADVVKENVTVLAKAPKRGHVKYLHGQRGRGTFTFYAGHDPEDYQHFVGDPKTDLSLHKRSPGYRLILNNILFPAAEKKKKKT